MNIPHQKSQSGFALLIFIVMLMGIGGFVLVGYGQGVLKEVEAKRFEHNKRVLGEAKQALLQFAYNYPNFYSEGPGRLPCPDDDNNGLTGPLDTTLCESVGRLPWLEPELHFYDARDADNARLWYAVSGNFHNLGGGPVVNSNSVGTLTLVDQSQNIIYNGAVAGIAAVIIAPGPPLTGQDRNADPLDPANYLDSFNGFDNSQFVNGSSANADGFILGPVRDPAQNIIVINDQIIVITAEEVIAMAEKATLQAYRDAIQDYQKNVWPSPTFSSADYRYPWLDPYISEDDLTSYNAEIPSPLPPVSEPFRGRLPSIFGKYFSGSGSEEIKSRLEIDIHFDGVSLNDTTGVVDVQFNGAGDLVTGSNLSIAEQTFWLWDGHASTPDPNSPRDGVWELCTGTAGSGPWPATGDAEDDCNRKFDGTFKTPSDSNPDRSDVWLEVKKIRVGFNTSSALLTFPYTDLKGTPLTYDPPNGSKNATVSADYNNNSGYLNIIYSEVDTNFRQGFNFTYSGPSFGASSLDRIRVGIRYYPELPAWALDNAWHDEIMMAYSHALRPDGDGTCTLPLLPFVGATNLNLDYCLVLENSAGAINDKTGLLILAGTNLSPSSGLSDEGGALAYFADDLKDIFEGENATPAVPYNNGSFWTDYYNPSPSPPDYERLEANLTFDRRPVNGTGNDVILALE